VGRIGHCLWKKQGSKFLVNLRSNYLPHLPFAAHFLATSFALSPPHLPLATHFLSAVLELAHLPLAEHFAPASASVLDVQPVNAMSANPSNDENISFFICIS